MKRSVPPPNAFKPGHTLQPTPEQRPSSIKLANRQRWAAEMRNAMQEGIPAAQVVAWIYEAVELGRQDGDGKVLLNAAEMALLWGVGKPREQLSEREGIDMLGVIEQAAAEMRMRTIDGVATETETETKTRTEQDNTNYHDYTNNDNQQA